MLKKNNNNNKKKMKKKEYSKRMKMIYLTNDLYL